MQSIDRFDISSSDESDVGSDRLSRSPITFETEHFSSMSSELSTSPPAPPPPKKSTRRTVTVPRNTPVPVTDDSRTASDASPPLPNHIVYAMDPNRISNPRAPSTEPSAERRVDGTPEMDKEEAEACKIRPVDFLEVSDELPSTEILDSCANLPVYDSHGDSRPFRSLYSGREHQGQRQLVIFVRHFYCQACQYFLRVLVDTLDPHAYFSLPVPTTITIIGCGKSSMIPRYASITTCPFRIYADPTRRLYKALGMSKWGGLFFGPRPEYLGDQNKFDTFFQSASQMAQARPLKDGRKGGNVFQVGGEFLFEDGKPVWCHKMHSVRTHAEMKTLRKVLEMADEDDETAQQLRLLDLHKKKERLEGKHDKGSKRSSAGVSAPNKGMKLVRDARGVQAYLCGGDEL